MAHPEIYLNLDYNQKLIFAVAIVVAVLVVSIVAKLKNKAKKHNKKQNTHNKIKMPNWANVISNYDIFIKENTKNMGLYERKDFIKDVNIELYSMMMRGVR